MSVSPTSLANLRPAWRSGETGNAGGRPRGYEPIPSKLRRMQDWPLEKLRATYADESASVAVRVCARMLLMAMEGDDSTARQAFVEVADQTADVATYGPVRWRPDPRLDTGHHYPISGRRGIAGTGGPP